MGRGVKLSESDIKNNVIKKIEALDHKVELVGIEYENNYIKASNAILLLRCPEHNKIEKVKYFNFINWGWHCNECNMLSNRSDKQEIENRIIEILNKSNELGTDLELIRFCDDKWTGYGTNNAKAEIRCNKHGIITTLRISNILRGRSKENNYRLFCPECRKEYGSPSHRTDPKLAAEELEEKFPNSVYDFSKVAETYETLESEVTVICPIHGEFTKPYKYLINSNDPRCPHCYEEHLLSRNRCDGKSSLVSCDDALDILNIVIIEKNKNPDVDIKFLGFVDNKWIGIHTKLILHCNIHNITWTTTTYDTFRKPDTLYVCPECRVRRQLCQSSSIGETKCLEELQLITVVDRQYKIKINPENNIFNVSGFIIVDFYIPSKNIIIEYNGSQHYTFNTCFHNNNYQEFVNQVNRDEFLKRYCKENNIKLLIIPYKDDKRIPEIIEKFIKEGIDITTKVEVKPLPPAIYQETCKSLIRLRNG